MSINRVSWTEGLFLRAHLFQQQERYLEFFAHQRTLATDAFFWGFRRISLNTDSLVSGKLSLNYAEGVFPDGSPFDALHTFASVPSIQITEKNLGQVISLALPIKQPHGEETVFAVDESEKSLARYVAIDEELFDSSASNRGTQVAQISKMRAKLLFDNEVNDSWTCLPIAKVKSVLSSREVILDEDFVPPVLTVGTHFWLTGWLDKLINLCSVRADNLASRMVAGDGEIQGVADIGDYLLLQIMNKYEPVLRAYAEVQTLQPLDLYFTMVEFSGELSTFVKTTTRRPQKYNVYDHKDPYQTFHKLFFDVHTMLNEILVKSAEKLALQEKKGMSVAVVDPTMLEQFGSIIVAVSANMSAEALIPQFPAQAKFASVDYLPELIRSHLPGLPINLLAIPPRQIPYHSDYVYFELARTGNLWKEIQKTGSIAMYVAGKLPGLQVELWGVRNNK